MWICMNPYGIARAVTLQVGRQGLVILVVRDKFSREK